METNDLPHKSGLKVPEDYFNTFEERLETQLFLEDKKVSGFKMPENYLKEFKVEIKEDQTKPSKVISLFTKRTVITVTSIAATIALLFTLTLKNKTITFDALENDTLSAYILDETNNSDLASLLDDITLEEADFLALDTENIDAIINTLELDDIIQY